MSKPRVLLTNGRFPVTIDLARQLHRAGYKVFCVDPMEFHMCKFSICVKQSFQVPAPRVDAKGYVDGVRRAIEKAEIDLIIPMHEEIFYLAESGNKEILRRLFAPRFDILVMLHNKWEFTRFLDRTSLAHPETHLIRTKEDLKSLDMTREWALKPVYGRAASNVHHLKPGTPLLEAFEATPDIPYVAQEWMNGSRFCSYSIVRNGKVQAFCLYPVKETIDGSSCVYFEAVEHPEIHEYVERVAAALPDTSAQLAFDFIENGETLVAIECNPRATSGIHLYSGTTHLAKAFLDPDVSHHTMKPALGAHRQVAPGMLMWKRDKEQPLLKQYLSHMKNHLTTKDVMFSIRDIWPTLMQPFLLTSYYEICRERNMRLPAMFQWDVTWEPEGEHLQVVNKMLEKKEKKWLDNSVSV